MSLFFPKDKRWSFDLRVSKGLGLGEYTHLSVFLDVFNLFDQVYWDRSDFPNPRRWAQVGLEVRFR
jgi:outer membrane receptor protein involved in Fe transport